MQLGQQSTSDFQITLQLSRFLLCVYYRFHKYDDMACRTNGIIVNTSSDVLYDCLRVQA